MSNVMMQVNHLSAGYQGHKVIEDISFQVEQGKIYSIIGPNWMRQDNTDTSCQPEYSAQRRSGAA